jgi:hypothetical protein
MRQDVRTSDHWRVVRNFVQQVRTDAHELTVERNVMQEILQLCDKLGTEYVMDMIQHEKRVLDGEPINYPAGSLGGFWAAKDAQDEEDYNKPIRSAIEKTTEGATHGI